MNRWNEPHFAIAVENLVARARAGDAEAEKELFERLNARVRTLAKRRVWDPQEAEDLAQETLKTVYEKYRVIELSRGFLPWVFVIFHNKVGNYLKTKRSRSHRSEVLEDFNASSEDQAIRAFEIWECLEKALRLASPECRKIFRLLLLGGDRPEMLAAFPGERPGTVDSRVSRCRKRLLDYFEKETP